MTPAGLPHSVIRGSRDVCSSPRLFAAYHDLLRQTAPRHPPWTRIRLTIFSLHPFLEDFSRRASQAFATRPSQRWSFADLSTPPEYPKEVFSPTCRTHLQHAGHLPSLFMSKIISQNRFAVLPARRTLARSAGQGTPMCSVRCSTAISQDETATLMRLQSKPHRSFAAQTC